MKARTLLFALILMATAHCKYDSLPVFGIITGYDARLCACCGGLMINFNNQTQSYSGDFYLIDNAPSDLGIQNNATFPIYAEVKYTLLSRCPGNVIRINSFRKIK